MGLKDSDAAYLTYPLSGEKTLFSVTNFSGDQSNIQLANASPFVEVLATSGAPLGVKSLADGTVRVNLGRAATTSDSTTVSALTGALDNALMGVVQNAEIQDLQSVSDSSKNSALSRARFQKSLRISSKDPLESLVTAFSDTNMPVLNFGGDRSWLAPYAVRVRNHGVGNASAFTEKSYGLLLGSNYYLAGMDMKIIPLIGIGGSSTQYDLKAHSHNRARTLILGMVASKQFIDKKNRCVV